MRFNGFTVGGAVLFVGAGCFTLYEMVISQLWVTETAMRPNGYLVAITAVGAILFLAGLARPEREPEWLPLPPPETRTPSGVQPPPHSPPETATGSNAR